MELKYSHFLESTVTVLQGLPKLPETASAADLAVYRPVMYAGQANRRV